MDRLFHPKDIIAEYGLSEYETQTMLRQVQKYNIGRGKQRSRWVVKQSDIELYLSKKKQGGGISGLDEHGMILRRR